MKTWKCVSSGVVAYSLVLICTAPATLVDAGVSRATDGTLRVAEARGSVWSGAGLLELIDARRHTGISKAVSWHLLATSLWRGQLAYEIQLADSVKPVTITISPSRVELSDASIMAPVSAISVAAPQLAPAQLTGELSITAAHVVADHGGVRGNATLHWRNAGSALSPVSPLGEYEIQVESDDAGIRWSLLTLKGPLDLNGRGSGSRRSPPAFSAIARVPPEYTEQLAPLLRTIASESADGAFRLVLR